MKRLPLLCLIVAFAGCASIATREEADLHRQVDAHFDLSAVHLFLRQLVRDYATVGDVSINKTQIGDAWLIDESWLPVGLTSGDWTFQRSIGSASEFELSYRIDQQTAVIFHCERIARGQFRVISFGKEQLVTLTDCRIIL